MFLQTQNGVKAEKLRQQLILKCINGEMSSFTAANHIAMLQSKLKIALGRAVSFLCI